jgi:translation initiation factor IF-3
MSSIQSLYNLAEDFSSIEILFGMDNDDTVGLEHMLHNVIPWIEKNSVKHKIVIFERFGYNNLHKYVNGLAENSVGSWLFFWNDDAVMQTQAWDARIREKTGEFKLLSVHTHNEHPYSIFPILPRQWFEILGHVSQHSSNDAYVSNLAYYLDIFERIDVYCDHNRFDVSGINYDETYHQRQILEGRPDQPGDFNHPDQVKIRTRDAAALATWMQDQGLDLVEIAAGASPPVCRIVDFSKFKYEQKKKNKELKAKAVKVVIKEIRFGPNTSEHDFDFKVKHAKSFLGEGAKIKAYVHFVGRSIVFSDRGRDLLARFTAALTEDGKVEMEPKLEGKRMFLIMAPRPKK